MLNVDDLIVAVNVTGYISSLIIQVIEIKDLGRLHQFLGIEVDYTSTGLFLSQTKYAQDLLNQTSMLGCKPTGSPCNYKTTAHGDTSPLAADPTCTKP